MALKRGATNTTNGPRGQRDRKWYCLLVRQRRPRKGSQAEEGGHNKLTTDRMHIFHEDAGQDRAVEILSPTDATGTFTGEAFSQEELSMEPDRNLIFSAPNLADYW